MNRKKPALAILLLATLIAGYWLLPINGRLIVVPEEATLLSPWPQMRLAPPVAQGGQPVTLLVTDIVPWAYVQLTIDGKPTPPQDWQANPEGTWTWRWVLDARTWQLDASKSHTIIFYHDCATGCTERGLLVIGSGETTPAAEGVSTKLGVVFANPDRDWHGRRGWDIELTYAHLSEQEYWGVNDLATRVHQAVVKGLRVLVRVDYTPGQTVPPTNDHVALAEYLRYLRRLARDDRLRPVYGYIIGSGYNALDSNTLADAYPVTPRWYARLFNGYGEPVSHTDNAVQTIRAENPTVRVLVGPVRPWNWDQGGQRPYTIDVPWLNYMNTLVAALDEETQAKMAAGIPLVAPDGFAINAFGRLDAPELAGHSAAEEPRLDLRRSQWGGAQAGFRVYRDWLDIINAYPTTRGLPVYINAANTFVSQEGVVPAQNYTRGWLTAALEEVNHEPQIQALCWFLDDDRSGDTRWDWFSLTRHPGRLLDAAEEFDNLLQRNR